MRVGELDEVLGVGGGITEEEDELEERAENRTHDAAAKEAGATERERHERVAPGRWVPEQCGEELVAEDEGAPCEEDPDCDKALECHCHGGIPLPRSHDGEARARSNVRSASMWCADDGPVEGRRDSGRSVSVRVLVPAWRQLPWRRWWRTGD